ncbi:MAG: MerR family transcriptional regulator [Gammaproteobacteria bacterium]|nr:MerR family transcriptional regulator [Gammaproteobacteria bacterium]
MKSIGQLGKQFSISRSTLIYYDKKGLLKPSSRSEANYRLYTNGDIEKLKLILIYRNGGLSLEEITGLLNSKSGKSTSILTNRLQLLNQEIAKLRQQQQIIVQIIGQSKMLKSTRLLDKDRWVKLLRATGLSDDDMEKWHIEFERAMPEMHQDFLESLGLSQKEIRAIRKQSKQAEA